MQKISNRNNNASKPVIVPSCIDGDFCVSEPRQLNGGILTMAFVDSQPLESVYNSEQALKCGTLFPNINKPFLCGGMMYE
ncbi:MAG: spore coat associated protein CotJA [Clostridia bacterium]|nr:spore coat associated protein CotJA [Clostridia bacterium]